MTDNFAPIVQAKQAERALIGGVFRHPPAIHDAAVILRPTDFYEGHLGIVWEAMLSLCRENHPCDLVAVSDRLFRAGRLEEVGLIGEPNSAYGVLAKLYNDEPTGAQVAYHAGVVRDYAILRKLMLAANKILERAQTPNGTALEMLAESEREIFAVADMGCAGLALPIGPTVDAVVDAIDQRQQQPEEAIVGVATGIHGLDTLTAGLKGGELLVIGARPSVGKTALAAAIASAAARDGGNVLFCSLEQSRAELAQRLLVALSGVDGHAVRHASLTAHDMERLSGAHQILRPLPLWVDDGAQQSVLRIAGNARRIKRQHGLSLIVVDYLQLIDAEDKRLPRHEQVASLSRALKHVARDVDVPLVALAQLNRQSEGRTDSRPRMSDLREGGSIEADADMVLLLHRPPEAPDILQLIMAKNRNGPVGEFEVFFDRKRMEFRPLDNPFQEDRRHA